MSAWNRLGFWLLKKQEPLARESAVTLSLLVGTLSVVIIYATYSINYLRGRPQPVVENYKMGYISSRTLEDERELKKAFKLRDEE